MQEAVTILAVMSHFCFLQEIFNESKVVVVNISVYIWWLLEQFIQMHPKYGMISYYNPCSSYTDAFLYGLQIKYMKIPETIVVNVGFNIKIWLDYHTFQKCLNNYIIIVINMLNSLC